MSFSYRVIEFEGSAEGPFRRIHQVFYNKNGELEFFSTFPAYVIWNVKEGDVGRDIVDMISQALEKPVLKKEDFER